MHLFLLVRMTPYPQAALQRKHIRQRGSLTVLDVVKISSLRNPLPAPLPRSTTKHVRSLACGTNALCVCPGSGDAKPPLLVKREGVARAARTPLSSLSRHRLECKPSSSCRAVESATSDAAIYPLPDDLCPCRLTADSPWVAMTVRSLELPPRRGKSWQCRGGLRSAWQGRDAQSTRGPGGVGRMRVFRCRARWTGLCLLVFRRRGRRRGCPRGGRRSWRWGGGRT